MLRTVKGRLLIVQDHAFLRRLLALYLSTAGYRVEEAADSLAAVAAIRQAVPDAMILDLATGTDLVWRLRRDPTVPVIPVVVLTVTPESDPRIQALLRLPAVSYKAKDGISTLEWMLDDILGEARLHGEADRADVNLFGHAGTAASPLPL